MALNKLEAFYTSGEEIISFRTSDVVVPPDPFIIGVTRPQTLVNVGFLGDEDDDLETINVDTTYTTNGQEVSYKRFRGNTNRQNLNGYFHHCVFEGKMSNTSNNIMRANHSSQAGAIFEDCTFRNRWFPSDNASNGAHGGCQCHDAGFVRCDFSQAVDGIGIITPGNVYAHGCVMHDHWFFSPDANHLGDGTHVDGVQCHGGAISNVDLFGCDIQGVLNPTLPNSQANIAPHFTGSTLDAGNSWRTEYFDNWNGGPIPGSAFSYPIHAFPPWGTSAVLFGFSSGSSLSDIRIREGWLNGGGLAMVNIASGFNNTNVNSFEIINNAIGSIGRDRRAADGRPYVVIRSSGLTSTELTVTGNYNEDDGTPNNNMRNG